MEVVLVENLDIQKTQLNTRTCRHGFKNVFKASNVTIYDVRTCVWSLRYVTLRHRRKRWSCAKTHISTTHNKDSTH